MKTIFRSSFFV